jgi:hypothetical protein
LIYLGPSVLEIVNSLLKHLKQSIISAIPVDDVEAVADEKQFQESLISALAEFAYHLPDYQKIEIMMFIIGRTPVAGEFDPENVPAETLLQHMLLKCLLKVCFLLCVYYAQSLNTFFLFFLGQLQIPVYQLLHLATANLFGPSFTYFFGPRRLCSCTSPRNSSLFA